MWCRNSACDTFQLVRRSHPYFAPNVESKNSLCLRDFFECRCMMIQVKCYLGHAHLVRNERVFLVRKTDNNSQRNDTWFLPKVLDPTSEKKKVPWRITIPQEFGVFFFYKGPFPKGKDRIVFQASFFEAAKLLVFGVVV